MMEEERVSTLSGSAAALNSTLAETQRRLQAVGSQGSTVQVSLSKSLGAVNSQLNQLKNTLIPVANVGLQLFSRLLSLLQPVAQGMTNLVTTLFGNRWTGVSTGLDSAVKATKQATTATKKLAAAQRDLMGFDEIQRLSSSGSGSSTTSGGGGGTSGGGGSGGVTIPVETLAWAERLKQVLADIWSPFQAAWQSKGAAVLQSANAMLAALRSTAALAGQTWLNVWTGGSGQRIIEGVLDMVISLCGTVEALANRFGEAWSYAGNGTRIVQSLLGMVEDLVNTAAGMSAATKDWASGLNLTPIVSGFADLLEQLRPLASLLEGALAWGYENILLPLAKWTIESAASAALNLLSGGVKAVTGALNLLQPIGLAVWEGFLQPVAAWTGGAVTALLNDFGDALSWCGERLQGIADILNASTSWQTKLEQIGGYLVDGLKAGVTKGVAAIGSWLYNSFVQPIVSSVKTLFGVSSPSTVFQAIGVALVQGLQNGIKGRLDTMWSALSGSWAALKGHFTDIAVTVTAAIKTTWADLQERWNGIKSHLGNIAVSVTASIQTTWASLKARWEGLTANIKDKTVSFSAKVTTTAASLWNNFKSGWAGKSLGLKVTWVKAGLTALQTAISTTLFSGKGWPKLAFAARGGVFDSPTLTLLGEAGREAVVPLENNTGWMDTLARRIAAQSGGGNTSGGAQVITVQCVLDGKIVAENTVRYINSEARRTGVSPVAAYL
ncbi:MAG: hypothetical protein LUC48_10485 [Clostridiales bacterium]|nr:hypothetical protein [Clostridiales bacterium]